MKLLTQQHVEQERIYYKQKTTKQGNNNKIQTEKTNNIGKSQSCNSQIRPVQGELKLVAMGSQGKARQWTNSGRSNAEKISRVAENTKKKQEHKNKAKQIQI
jgi:hypothetical protein